MDLITISFLTEIKLMGDSMVSFREKLIESEILVSYPAVVKKLKPRRL